MTTTEPAKPLQLVVERCPRCGNGHVFTIDVLPKANREIYLLCPNITRFYRLASFHFSGFSGASHLLETKIREYIRHLHGEDSLEEKLNRWRAIQRAHIWPIDEFNAYFEDVRQAYVDGLFYSANECINCFRSSRAASSLYLTGCAV